MALLDATACIALSTFSEYADATTVLARSRSYWCMERSGDSGGGMVCFFRIGKILLLRSLFLFSLSCFCCCWYALIILRCSSSGLSALGLRLYACSKEVLDLLSVSFDIPDDNRFPGRCK